MVMDEEGEDVEVGTSSTLYTDKADNCRTYQQVPFILISIWCTSGKETSLFEEGLDSVVPIVWIDSVFVVVLAIKFVGCLSTSDSTSDR